MARIAVLYELRDALTWATDDELEAMVELLFRPRFNPIDYVQTPVPETVQRLPYRARLRAIEERLCFLAADGLTVLKGQTRQLSYRTLLLDSCDYLKIAHSEDFATDELEAELFLHVLQATWKKLPAQERAQLSKNLHQSLIEAPETHHLGRWVQQDHLRLLLEGGSAIAVSAVIRPLLLQQIARQVMLHVAKRQVAREALKHGGAAAVRVQTYVAMQLASRGIAVNLARYGAARSVLGVLGPALWAWFVADLGWRAIATNRGRVIPALFLIAQIRLTRTETYGDYAAAAS